MAEEGRYRVVWSPKAVDVLKQALRQRSDAVARSRFAGFIRTIESRLRTEPLDLGEVEWARGNVAKHLAIVDPVAIHFRVDSLKKIVAVQRCQILGGS